MSDDRRPDERDDDSTLLPGSPEERFPTVTGSGPVGAPSADRPAEIAGYRIVGMLGRGGMGVVWEAEQDRPRRRVALKVMRRDHVVDELHVRMFHREAETLARLRHPNIAAIYGSGHTADGHDYFAMELVQGPTLDRWLDGRPPVVDGDELRLRLQMFRTLCDAVHYAHQRGVIHRDLKPSNIIVTNELESSAGTSARAAIPAVKILDFGLARITDSDVAATTVSEIGVIKGTLQYMSPEQARGDADAIDVRTDVYALGVILYELLTGTRPYDVTSAALAAAVRVICEQDPQPLRSTWRGARRLDRDVETIVLKTLEKSADRRYTSAAALAEDVERYLESRPIIAHPPSAAYQMQKFAQRHRGLVAAAAAVLAALVLGLVTTTWGFRTARAEAARSRQVAAFLGDMLEGVGPSVAQGADTALLRSILERAADRLDEELGDQPRVAAALHDTIGRTYVEAGDYDAAERHLPVALELKRSVYGEDDPETRIALFHVGLMRYRQGRVAEAEQLYRSSLEGWRRARQSDTAGAATVAHSLGILLYENGRVPEGVPLLEESLEIRRSGADPHPDAAFQTMTALGLAHLKVGRAEAAEPLLEGVLEQRRAILGETHPHTIESVYNLAGLYGETGRVSDAERLYLDALARMESVHGPDHPTTIQVRNQVGIFYRGLQRLQDAEDVIVRALADARTALGDDHPKTLKVRQNLALLRFNQQRLEEAEQIIRPTLEAMRTVSGADHPDTLDVTLTLLQLLRGLGRTDEASAVAEELVAVSRGRWGDDHPRTLLFLNEAAHVWTAAGDHERAAESYLAALDGRRRVLGETHPHTMVSLNSLAVLRMRQDDYAAARPLLEEALDVQRSLLGEDHVDTVIAAYNLAHAASNLGDEAEAERLFSDSVERWSRTIGELHPYTLSARRGLAELYLRQERFELAESALLDVATRLVADPAVPGRVRGPVVERLAQVYDRWGRAADAAAWRRHLE